MKKIAAMLLAVIMVFGFTACGGTGTDTPAADTPEDTQGTDAPQAAGMISEEEASIKIGITSQTMKEKTYRDMMAGAEERAIEKGVYMEWQPCDLDASKELDIIHNYITRGFDVIAIEPVNGTVSVEMAQACVDAGVPFISLEVDFEGENMPDILVSGDFYGIGQAKVDKFVEVFGDGPANIVLMDGTLGDSVATAVHNGAVDQLKNYPQITVVHQEWCPDWARDFAMTTMQNVLAKTTDIQGVISANDAMGVGAYNACEEIGIEKDVIFVSMDDDEDAVMLMQKGIKYYSVDKNSKLYGTKVIDAAISLANGEEPAYDKVNDAGVKMSLIDLRWNSCDDLTVGKEMYPHLFE